MEILDDEVIKKITYSPTCQETFKEYRGVMTMRIIGYSTGAILCGLALFWLLNTFEIEDLMEELAFYVFGAAITSTIVFSFIAINAIMDLVSNKLNIRQRIFLGVEIGSDSNTGKNDAYGGYVVKFEDCLPIKLPEPNPKFWSIPKNTEVYVVQTSVSNTLLDIIPVNEI